MSATEVLDRALAILALANAAVAISDLAPEQAKKLAAVVAELASALCAPTYYGQAPCDPSRGVRIIVDPLP